MGPSIQAPRGASRSFPPLVPFRSIPAPQHIITLSHFFFFFLNMDIQPWPTDFMKPAFFTPSLPGYTFYRACFINSFLLSILEQSWRDGMQDENSLIGTFFYCPLMELQANYIFHRGTDVLSGLRYHQSELLAFETQPGCWAAIAIL